jgi:glyoxylase I family protein
MKLTTCHHIAMIVPDYQEAYEFYVEKLGFQVLADHQRATDRLLNLRAGTVTLELFVKPKAPQRPSYPEAQGLRHLAFQVSNVAAVVAELTALGIVCEPIRQDSFTGEAMTFCQAPGGLPLEFHE